MPHEKLVYWGKYDIENLSRLRRNIEVDDLKGRSTGDGVVVRSISIGKGRVRSKELRFSFGLPLVVSAESVSAIGITVVSTKTVISTVKYSIV